MSVIPALRGWRQEDHEFKMSLCYTIKACPKKKEKEEEDEVLGKLIHGRGPELQTLALFFGGLMCHVLLSRKY